MAEDTEGLDLTRASIKLPRFKNISAAQFYDFENNVVDHEDLSRLNATTNAARLALFKVTENINQYERLEKEAKLNYERAQRRELLRSTAKTADERRARADLFCEDLENEWILYSQIKDELIRLSNALRLELQTLQAMGNNIRQQMRVI